MKTNKQTSIQISSTHRDLLKDYCEKYGYSMSGFLEKLIEEKSNPKILPDKIVFSGVGGTVKGSTPFGKYDDDTSFQKDCQTAMHWASKRLGYPVVDIEMLDIHFYANYEEAVFTYCARNAPQGHYSSLKERGKEWINRYFLALCKDTLGTIRQKYDSIPIPGGQISLDGKELKLEARAELESLLREEL